jgi:hypothetical protein
VRLARRSRFESERGYPFDNDEDGRDKRAASLRAGQDEALEDLAQVGSAIRASYGALTYKKARCGFDLDAALAQARSEIMQATNEGDRVRPIYRLLAQLRDGHVSLTFPVQATDSATSGLPMIVTPIEDAFVVDKVLPGLPVVVGDKLFD